MDPMLSYQPTKAKLQGKKQTRRMKGNAAGDEIRRSLLYNPNSAANGLYYVPSEDVRATKT